MRKMTRQEFLQLALASSVAVPLLGYGCTGRRGSSSSSAGPGENTGTGTFYDELGFQVYTLRDLLVENADSLFRALSEAGIKNIEFYDPLTLNHYVPIVKEYGMNPLSTHFSSGYVTGIWEGNQAPKEGYGFESVLEECAANGIKHMGIAILTSEERQSLDACRRFAEKANLCGEKSRDAGIQLFYHNHNFEFAPIGGSTPYAEMLKIFDRELVKLELDVFWATVAGQDPVEWIHRIAEWMLFLHLKDLKKGFPLPRYTTDIAPESFVELGDGMVELESILAAAKEAGVRYAIIDQDITQMEDKIASVNRNTAYIKGLGI
jgi:sugar phosphate isomerase/epimerase